jgi:hypothetical protein
MSQRVEKRRNGGDEIQKIKKHTEEIITNTQQVNEGNKKNAIILNKYVMKNKVNQ